MAKETSVAPKERVNIRFSPATGGLTEEIELPFKQVVVGEFGTAVDETPLEDRSRIDINKDNFNSVMTAQNLKLDFSVNDMLSGEADASLPVSCASRRSRTSSPSRWSKACPSCANCWSCATPCWP